MTALQKGSKLLLHPHRTSAKPLLTLLPIILTLLALYLLQPITFTILPDFPTHSTTGDDASSTTTPPPSLFLPTVEDDGTLPLEKVYAGLADHYLVPWKGVEGFPAPRVTKRMLDRMEVPVKGAYFRVRIVGGKVWFRTLVEWPATYRTQRMFCMLENIAEAARKHDVPNTEFYVGVSDSPHMRTDTLMNGKDHPGFPAFSRVTGHGFINIPVPDPVEQGCYGGYAIGNVTIPPWEEKISKGFFRGSTSQYNFFADNWHVSQRIKIAQYSMRYPELLDAGLTKLFKMVPFHGFPAPTKTEILNSTGIATLPSTKIEEQVKYKYIIDIDGGLGSSRKRSILASGSVLIRQESPFYLHYEPLLKPHIHYIPLPPHLQTLPTLLTTLQTHDTYAHHVALAGLVFHKRHLSHTSDILYWSIVLKKYAALLTDPPVDESPVGVNQCDGVGEEGRRVFEAGFCGCSSGWLAWDGARGEWVGRFERRLAERRR
ncbi:hypothetical protein HDV00_004988, partial [Rhizophlyctis rosea]